MIRDELLFAALNCPHSIDSNRVSLDFSDRQPGHNALRQLSERLHAAQYLVRDDVLEEVAILVESWGNHSDAASIRAMKTPADQEPKP